MAKRKVSIYFLRDPQLGIGFGQHILESMSPELIRSLRHKGCEIEIVECDHNTNLNDLPERPIVWLSTRMSQKWEDAVDIIENRKRGIPFHGKVLFTMRTGLQGNCQPEALVSAVRSLLLTCPTAT